MGDRLDPGEKRAYPPARMFAVQGGDPCAGGSQSPAEARARLLTWLASGVRDVTWGLCSLPRDRWLAEPPAHLAETVGSWPALRHVRHLSLYAAQVWLPALRLALGLADAQEVPRLLDVERRDAAWDARVTEGSAAEWIEELATARFEMLRLLESATDAAWTRPLPAELVGSDSPTADPPGLAWLMARVYQQELEHLSAVWKLALYWDRVPASTSTGSGLSLQPADRMESH